MDIPHLQNYKELLMSKIRALPLRLPIGLLPLYCLLNLFSILAFSCVILCSLVLSCVIFFLEEHSADRQTTLAYLGYLGLLPEPKTNVFLYVDSRVKSIFKEHFCFIATLHGAEAEMSVRVYHVAGLSPRVAKTSSLENFQGRLQGLVVNGERILDEAHLKQVEYEGKSFISLANSIVFYNQLKY